MRSKSSGADISTQRSTLNATAIGQINLLARSIELSRRTSLPTEPTFNLEGDSDLESLPSTMPSYAEGVFADAKDLEARASFLFGIQENEIAQPLLRERLEYLQSCSPRSSIDYAVWTSFVLDSSRIAG